MVSDRHELSPEDEAYPEALRDLSHPPKIFVRGSVRALHGSCISIVGARRCSPYGLACAELAARIATEAGICVVSGGAVGCDQAAGRSALAAKGRHIVVLGTGADVAYPSGVGALLDDALEAGGAVVSLEPWGAGPRRYAFPKRNRVIAALSRALVICEAGIPSGTFSTAETALEIGRELLCMPGSILSPLSAGTNRLIAEGATCIADEDSHEVAISRIYGTLRFSHNRARGVTGLSRDEQRAMSALGASPLRADALGVHLSMDVISTLRLLGSLETEGLVQRMPDGTYMQSKRALQLATSFGTMEGR